MKMAHGVPTPEETRERFRAHYLLSGNARASAKAVGLPARTGQDIAMDLSGDAEFAKARARLRANALDEAERSVMEVVRVGLARFKAPAPEINIPEGSGAVVNITDKRADYGKLVIDAHKTIAARTRIDAEKSGAIVRPDVKLVIIRPGDDRPLDSESAPEDGN